MREIKFRAWDEIDKEMFDVIALFFPYESRKNKTNRIIVQGRGGNTDTEKDDCILMQYTGLKDKNGKEIYEGDVVKCLDAEWKNGKVMFRNGAFRVHALVLTAPENTWEVIGNIYENPELLT